VYYRKGVLSDGNVFCPGEFMSHSLEKDGSAFQSKTGIVHYVCTCVYDRYAIL
jgi:hypothetical protein